MMDAATDDPGLYDLASDNDSDNDSANHSDSVLISPALAREEAVTAAGGNNSEGDSPGGDIPDGHTGALLTALEEQRALTRAAIKDRKVIEEENSTLREYFFRQTDSITVVARVRGKDQADHDAAARYMTRNGNNLIVRSDAGEAQSFAFDLVLGSGMATDVLNRHVRAWIRAFMDGDDVTILADGATGSGKSWTFFVGPASVIAEAIKLCLAISTTFNAEGWECSLSCSVVEIYEEQTYDLLRDVRSHASPLRLVQYASGGYHNVVGQRVETIKDHAGFLAMMRRAGGLSEVAATKKNAASSRGHKVVIISSQRTRDDGDTLVKSQLFLSDLAGSERMVNIDPQDKTALKELLRNNKGREVVRTVLSQRHMACPGFANSALSKVLSRGLGPKARVAIVNHVSPLPEDLAISLESIKFAVSLQESHVKQRSRRQDEPRVPSSPATGTTIPTTRMSNQDTISRLYKPRAAIGSRLPVGNKRAGHV